MKYILFDDQGIDCPVVFNNIMPHRVIADRLSYMEPISAGFVSISIKMDSKEGVEKPYFNCYGESVSLRLKSQVGDSERVTRMMNFS